MEKYTWISDLRLNSMQISLRSNITNVWRFVRFKKNDDCSMQRKNQSTSHTFYQTKNSMQNQREAIRDKWQLRIFFTISITTTISCQNKFFTISKFLSLCILEFVRVCHRIHNDKHPLHTAKRSTRHIRMMKMQHRSLLCIECNCIAIGVHI